jgi:hypothetical protein
MAFDQLVQVHRIDHTAGARRRSRGTALSCAPSGATAASVATAIEPVPGFNAIVSRKPWWRF